MLKLMFSTTVIPVFACLFAVTFACAFIVMIGFGRRIKRPPSRR